MSWVNSLSDAEKWTFGLLAIATLVVFVALRFAIRHTRRTAAAKFRTAVLTTLSGLYPEPVNWPADVDPVLRKLFPALQTAVAQFWPFIPRRSRRAFDRAWFRYRCGLGRPIDHQCYNHYMDFGDNPDANGNFRRNVDALLSFARLVDENDR
jgi:hypothetical protein